MPRVTMSDGRVLEWRGLNICYCSTCEELFNSPAAFDYHLKRPKGKQAGGVEARHDTSGMPRNSKGYLVTRRMDASAAESRGSEQERDT
jgi:hypothetical protein